MTDPIRVNLSTEMGRQEVDDMVRLDNNFGTNLVDAVQDFALINTATGTVSVSDGETVVWTGAAKDVSNFNEQIARDIYGTCRANGIDVPAQQTQKASNGASGGTLHHRTPAEHPAAERPSMRHGG